MGNLRCFIAVTFVFTAACGAHQSQQGSFVSVVPLSVAPDESTSPAAPSTPELEEARFVSKEGRFSVAFPSAPNESSRPVDTGVGEFTIHELGVDVETPGQLGAYSVSYSDVPFEAPLMVESTQQGIRALPRKVVTERTTRIGPQSVEAWEVIFDDGPMEKIARYVQIDKRFYQVVVEYPKDARPGDAESFVQSFEPL